MQGSEKPSILLVGSGMRTSLENMYFRAFRNNGNSNVRLLDVDLIIPRVFKRRFVNRLTHPLQHATVSRNLHTHLSAHRRQYDLIIVFKGMPFSRATLEACRQVADGAIWVNINPDDPFNVASPGASNLKVVESVSFYDLYCIWSRKLVGELSNHGAKQVVYLPFGFDEEFHRPVTVTSAQQGMISFVGSWDVERERILTNLARYDLVIYGNGWDRLGKRSPLRKKVGHKDLFGEELAKVIGESSISLNLLRPQNAGSHNMRTFEIPAMGGVMLTNRTEEQQEFFPENKACYMYESVEELKNKIEFILVNRQETKRVMARGIDLAKIHSYSNRVKYLKEQLSI